MAVTSKHVISFISSQSGAFTKKEIVAGLLKRGPASRGKGRNQRTKRRSPEADLSVIETTLDGLVAALFLKREKSRFIRIHPFRVEGTIRSNTTGNAIVTTIYDDEIIIRRDDTSGANDTDRVTVRITDFKNGRAAGVVESVLRREKKTCFARVISVSQAEVVYLLLDVPGSREAASPVPDGQLKPGHIALILLEDGLYRKRQRCSLVESYTPDDDRYDLARIVNRHSLPEPGAPYPGADGADFSSRDTAPRTNYTGLFTVTIDGETAKDFDDAISISKKGGRYTLFVHIADVSSYVTPGSSIDREALVRGTSYYLGANVIPMLPEALSNDLCSLREGLDRLTMTVELEIDASGAVTGQKFTRGLIRVNRRLTYNLVERMLIDGERGQLGETLRLMQELATLLHNRRMSQGGLELALTDSELVYENGVAVAIRYAERLRSNNIIEEFMLAANVAVSRVLREREVPTLYRIHEEISPDSLLKLKNFLKQLRIPFKAAGDISTRIQEVLAHVAGKDIEHVINLVILKSLMQAYYGADPEGHFGLGFRDYTHFTSPIRRYPDLVVHRCLKSLIDLKKPPYTRAELVAIGDRSSEKERVAQSAERDFDRIKACRLVKSRVGELFAGVITGVSKYGFYVTLKEIPVEGMVPLRALTDDYYLVKEDDYTVIGKRYGKRFRIGDAIRVKLSAVDVDRMFIDFEVVP